MISFMRSKRFLSVDSVNGVHLSTNHASAGIECDLGLDQGLDWVVWRKVSKMTIQVNLVPRIRANTALQDRDPNDLQVWTRRTFRRFVN